MAAECIWRRHPMHTRTVRPSTRFTFFEESFSRRFCVAFYISNIHYVTSLLGCAFTQPCLFHTFYLVRKRYIYMYLSCKHTIHLHRGWWSNCYRECATRQGIRVSEASIFVSSATHEPHENFTFFANMTRTYVNGTCIRVG
jgi:hypothetical protein